MPPPISTPEREGYPCVVADGSLYFTSRRSSALGAGDIYRAQPLVDGSFAEPANLGPTVNDESGQGYAALVRVQPSRGHDAAEAPASHGAALPGQEEREDPWTGRSASWRPPGSRL